MPGIVKDTSIDVAIVGGGVIGLSLAAGLIKRNIKVKVYEQAKSFREIGAGMAFTANAIRCMSLVNPDIVSALRSGGSVPTSSDKNDPNDYLRWIDGYNSRRKDDPLYEEMLYKLNAGYRGFEGTRRDQFLEALVKVIPQEIVELKKRLNNIEEKGPNGRLQLNFSDGTSVEADAATNPGGEDNPASHPHYTQKIAYRALVPMEKAIEALGEYKARNQHNHIGPNAYLIHYPVANQTMINATAFLSDPNEWPDDKVTVVPALREDLEKHFADWNPCVNALIQHFPEKLEKWAVFDMWDYPAPYFNRGNICLAGDAAHASTPHHGAGACCGIEDVLCLCILMSQVNDTLRGDESASTKKNAAICIAFEVFDLMRRTRGQWLVNSSRRMCDLIQQPDWGDESKWIKAQTCFEEIRDRSFKIWHYDYDSMIKGTIEEYAKRQSALKGSDAM
ncbi:Salicylate hydroxylase [Daldinia childiae]|uniref:Salicylate hydroxylase n=1 Tax=Daldinia childiae TaxID=326645 RepID=UPI001446F355|nr:Salicylate hydroxylase [Daldinia childiae]KAF3065873.1 Salicylate hydroxylase [Daldinia childiae]